MGYITVNCHFITSDCSLKSAVSLTKHVYGSHTAMNLAAILKTITDEWNITDKVCCVTTDNAAKITNAFNHNSWKNLPCFAHKMNLMTNSLSEVHELSSLIQSVKNIVSYFHRSTKAYDKLKVIQA
uniref:DUF659 domain-containing protein n=1 Tax=Amphimedon queenslandica TaxID=400682 RepID=A0A1X7VXG0_AMPQE